jgi:hypothetical protein
LKLLSDNLDAKIEDAPQALKNYAQLRRHLFNNHDDAHPLEAL